MRGLLDRALVGGFALGVFAWFTGGAAYGQNRFEIPAQSLVIGTTGNSVPILADVDQDTYAFSVHVTFDSNKINVNGVSLGAPVAALSPEYTEGTVFNGTPGDVVYGVVFDMSDPITKHLSPGDNIQLLVLDVDVEATSATTATLSFQNDTAPPWRRNVMTDIDGDSVATLSTTNGTLTLTSLEPIIGGFVGNSGPPGQNFSITGEHFDQPGLVVRVDGIRADVISVVGSELIQAVAPQCTLAAPGTVTVQVCTDRGCDSDPSGFTFTSGCDDERRPPVIDSFLSNAGEEGQAFFVVGRNFELAPVTVTIDGNPPASPPNVIDDQTIRVTAPSCTVPGFVEVEVCNEYGCDSEPNGFEYTRCGPDEGVGPFLRGDCNQDGESTGSPTDGIFLLTWLFIGGSDPLCLAACDMNGDGQLSAEPTDAVYFFNFNFLGGAPIPPPLTCDFSMTPGDETLGCEVPDGCP